MVVLFRDTTAEVTSLPRHHYLPDRPPAVVVLVVAATGRMENPNATRCVESAVAFPSSCEHHPVAADASSPDASTVLISRRRQEEEARGLPSAPCPPEEVEDANDVNGVEEEEEEVVNGKEEVEEDTRSLRHGDPWVVVVVVCCCCVVGSYLWHPEDGRWHRRCGWTAADENRPSW